MSQAALWCVMNMFDIPDVDLLERIYDSATVRLAPNDTEIATITFDTGVAQGSITSLQQNNLFRTRDCLPKLKPQKKFYVSTKESTYSQKSAKCLQRAHSSAKEPCTSAKEPTVTGISPKVPYPSYLNSQL